MATPYYKVNNVDILSYLADGGLQIDENDLDSDDSGRTLDGEMHRGRVALKDKHTLKCMPLTTERSNTLLQLISLHAFVTVSTNIHPKYGNVIKTMYNSSRTAAVYSINDDGDVVWNDISFTLIEK